MAKVLLTNGWKGRNAKKANVYAGLVALLGSIFEETIVGTVPMKCGRSMIGWTRDEKDRRAVSNPGASPISGSARYWSWVKWANRTHRTNGRDGTNRRSRSGGKGRSGTELEFFAAGSAIKPN